MTPGPGLGPRPERIRDVEYGNGTNHGAGSSVHLPPVQLPAAKESFSNSHSIVQSPEEEGDDDLEEDELVEGKEEPQSPPGPTGAVKKKRRPHSTRRRIVQSCSECRRRKIRCTSSPIAFCILS